MASLNKIAKVNSDIILVLNKIDAAEDIPSLIKYVQDHIKYQFVVTPISSRTGENMEMVHGAVLKLLGAEKKDDLMATNIANKASIANKWILAASGSAAAIGAAPILGADFVPLTGLQVGLMLRLSTLYEKSLSKDNFPSNHQSGSRGRNGNRGK